MKTSLDLFNELKAMQDFLGIAEKLGASHALFKRMSCDEGFVQSIIELHNNMKQVTPEELQLVREWAEKLKTTDHPFDEPRSYYPVNRESTHRTMIKALQNGPLRTLFEKTRCNKNAEWLYAQVERCFHIGYIHSSVYWCGDLAHNHREWLGHPVQGIQLLPRCILVGHVNIEMGACMKKVEGTPDEVFVALHALGKKTPSISNIAAVNAYFAEHGKAMLDESRIIFRKAINELLSMCGDLARMLETLAE